ncbi:glycosyltransferase family 61 protein [Microbacterium elymi]|uniref:Glycosyltransferase family 61 protein n=1 Tax=Microbacterium elymi TaxID=2909587 RepID=A0ABY5NKN4_9MICO|nr:glycosyltransferase family 61 protein [Microbacterium elymi]UUT35743.1 glycosyltransferase family 61 protein [Microbacterium elymi]
MVVVADRPSRWRVQRWLRTFFTDDVTVYATGFVPSRTRQPGVHVHRMASPDSIAASMRDAPPPDIIIDARRPADEGQSVALWRAVYPHLAANGLYVHHRPGAQARDGVSGWAGVVEGRLPSQPTTGPLADDLISATSHVEGIDSYAVHTKARAHYLKVPERRIASLATRTPRLSIDLIDTRPGAHVTAKAAVRTNTPNPSVENLHTELDTPEITMRHYRGRIRVLSHMAWVHDQTLLPPSFRFPTEAIPGTVLAPDVTPDFVSIPARFDGPVPLLRGPIYDLTTAYHGHFGHFITEVPAKLWGWDEAKRRLPDLRAIVRIPPGYQPTYERELLLAYGLDDHDVVWQPAPAEVDSLVACTVLWQNHEPFWFHPMIRDVWARLRKGLVDADRTGVGRKLFVSRRPGMVHRDCRNAPAVEELFREHGFEVVFPEDHTLHTQAELFADARVVAGFGGSAMFNVLFAEKLQAMIVLNHEAYAARNEQLYAMGLGAELHYFWSAPDRVQAGRTFDPRAFHSAWEFDFERNGAALRETLRSLG